MNTPQAPIPPEASNPKVLGSGDLFDLIWEDDGPSRIMGYIDSPKTTLFIIERNSQNPYRGRMSGAVMPDEEDGTGLNENALVSWLQGFAAPQYLRDFYLTLAIALESERIDRLSPEEVRAELNAAGITDERINRGIQECREIAKQAIAKRSNK